MGLRLNYDIDTTIQNTKELYVNVSNVQYNLDSKKVVVSLTYWLSKDIKEKYKDSRYLTVKYAEVPNRFILYTKDNRTGIDLTLSNLLEFDAEEETNTNLMSWCYRKVRERLSVELGKYISDI